MSTSVVGSSTVYAPSTLTRAELARSVVDYIQGADDPELLEVANRSINLAISKLNARRWKKLGGRQDIALTVGQADYALAQDFKDPMKCEVLDSTGTPRARVYYKDFETFQSEHPDGSLTGDPDIYTIYYPERLLTLVMFPGQSFVDSNPTLRLRYYARIPHLEESSAKLKVPDEFSTFLVWRSRFDIASVRGEANLAALARSEAASAFIDLKRTDYDNYSDWSEY